jgi:CRP/FNR family transcriptional regulator, cyclic AMP receptor protein
MEAIARTTNRISVGGLSGVSTETKYLTRLVTEHPFLAGLNPRYRHLLTESASLMRFGVQQVIFHEGGDADHFYLIHTGRVSLETFVPGKGAVTVQTVGPNEGLGWSWLFPPYCWHFTARAQEPCEIVALGAANLREKIEENHDFGCDLMRRVSQVMLERLQATRRKLVEFYGVIE